MARGLANGEPITSQAQTREWDEGYSRVFGERKPMRGRWVYDEAQQKLVPADEYVAPQSEHAVHAPVMVDRFMEGARATDGTDISSRSKRKAYMERNGLADYQDYAGAREAKRKEREAKARGEFKPDPQLREQVGRALYKAKIIL